MADSLGVCRRYLFFAGDFGDWRNAGIALPAGWERERQQGRGLGERLERAFREVFRRGARKVIAIGVDTPWMGRGRLRVAFDWLDRADVVLGPCADGGYYLIGMRGLASGVFREVGWGTGTVLAATRRALESARASYRLLPPDFDLDRWEDLERARAMLRKHPGRAPALAAWIKHDYAIQPPPSTLSS